MNSRIDLTLQQREADEAELAKRTLAHKRRVGSSAELSSASNVARRRRRAQQLSNRQRSGLPGDRRLVVRLPARRKRSVAVEHGDRRSTHADREPAAARSQLRALRPGDDRGPDLREPAAHHRCRVGPDAVGERRARRDPGFDGRRRPGRGPVRHLSGLPGFGLDAARLQGALDSVAASYNDLFELRKIIAPNTPIIGHCYDYAIPNGAAPICAGPWLQPSLEFAGYDLAEGLNIVSAIIDSFYAMMNSLAGDATNNFILVDTRNTLARVAFAQNGWANELHPYPEGFALLAQKFLTVLRNQFPAGSI